MSTTEGSIDGDSLASVAKAIEITQEASDIGDTAITWLGSDGGPLGAIVTPDVVKAAREFWAEISREIASTRVKPLPKI